MSKLEELIYKRFLERKNDLDQYFDTPGDGCVYLPFFVDGVVDQILIDLKTKRYKHIKYAVATKGAVSIAGQLCNSVLCDEYEYRYLDLEKLLYE